MTAAAPAREGALTRALSPSQVTTYIDCAARWWFEEVAPRQPPTSALALGRAVHSAIALDLEARKNGIGDPSEDDIREEFSACWKKETAAADFRADEDPDQLAATGAEMSLLFSRKVAPSLKVAAIEKPVAGRIGSARTHGVIDVLTTDRIIIDVKTAAKKPTGISAAHRMQLTTYGLLEHSTAAVLITLTKTKEPAIYSQPVNITPADTQYATTMFSMVADAIGAGIHLPNRGSNLCGRKYCAHWRACEAEHGGHVRE
jgi:CRISPR/Cas system-associated exonuclease Cas4 (RecB family)